jgi:hypothetical protein
LGSARVRATAAAQAVTVSVRTTIVNRFVAVGTNFREASDEENAEGKYGHGEACAKNESSNHDEHDEEFQEYENRVCDHATSTFARCAA